MALTHLPHLFLRARRAGPSAPAGDGAWRLSLRLLAAAGVLLGASEPAQAIPAFARQLGVKCSTCHTPVPPRLNNLGVTFKRLGYRMPDADEEGRLVLKLKPSRSPFDDTSLIGDFRMERERGEPTTLVLDEVEAMAAGSIDPRVSYAAQVAWDGEFDLEALEGQLLLGSPSRNATARFGLLAPLQWEKWNHQRLTISRPLLVSTRVPIDGLEGPLWTDPQAGVELGLNLTSLGETGAMRSTFVSVGVFNGFSPADGELSRRENNGFKDVLLQATHLWGDSNTVSALYYRGKISGIGAAAFDDRVERWALVGNYRVRTGTDVLAGVGLGRDTAAPAGIGRVSSRGWFLEADHGFGERTALAVRYERFEPNRDAAGLDLRGPTLSATHHLFDNVLLAAEYRGLKTGDDERDRMFVVRAVLAY